MDFAWILHGFCMDFAWILHGFCMDFAWIERVCVDALRGYGSCGYRRRADWRTRGQTGGRAGRLAGA
jgi:hypothetical protein